MAKSPGRKTRIFVDEFDFSGRVSAVEIPFEVNVPEVTALSDGGGTFVEGQYSVSIVQNGFFDADGAAPPADLNIDKEMILDLVSGVDHLVGAYPGASAVPGAVGYEIQGRPSNEARPVEVAGAILLNVTWKGNGPVVRSTVAANGAVIATGAVTASNKNVGITIAGERFVAILRVLSVSGTGSITVEVEQSQNDGSPDTYTQLLAFTAKTAIGYQRLTTDLATEAWKRVNVTAFSGFTSATILVVVGKELGVT